MTEQPEVTDERAVQPLPILSNEITVNDVKRPKKRLWCDYTPVRVYSLPGGFLVTEAAEPDWPVVFTGGVGETHVFRDSRATAERMIDIIQTNILAPKARKPKFRLFSPRPKEHRYDVGDDIEIAFDWGRWGIKKRHRGMAPERLTTERMGMVADVLRHILSNTDTR